MSDTIWPDNRYKIIISEWVKDEDGFDDYMSQRKECAGQDGYAGSNGMCDYYFAKPITSFSHEN